MEKKNLFQKIAVACFAMFMVTLAVVGVTFAKYVKNQGATDGATVAAFGATVSKTGILFSDKYAADDTTTLSEENAISVESSTAAYKLAPGTKNLTGMTISAAVTSSEVAIKLALNLTVEQSGWTVGETAYEPVKFTVKKTLNGVDTYWDGDSWETPEAETPAATCVASQMARGNFNVNQTVLAGETYSVSYTITWAWAFNGDDAKDTALGEAGTALIRVISSASATQID